MQKITRRTFTGTAATALLSSSLAPAWGQAQVTDPGDQTETAVDASGAVGPIVGHVSTGSAKIWYRAPHPGRFTLSATAEGKNEPFQAHAEAMAQNDLCLTWLIEGLEPATRYAYQIHDGERPVLGPGDYFFRTPPEDSAATRTALAFGSCARNEPLELWEQMDNQPIDGLVLLGDTPYIDSTDLAFARQRHRDFVSIPQLAKLLRHTPMWGTWDDHDFGANDSDGRLVGKENTRQAFVEYRANATFGEHDQGIYTRFRHGPVEVWLLDTRWFARTEPSPVDPSRPTLLGAKQWTWLRETLMASTAPFKLITCGMIWDDKENRESDDWGSYEYERAALFQFLGDNSISGVVLIGGDIHCSRWLRYKTEAQVGYPIHQFIVSPIHDGIIPSLNVAHPDLVRGESIPHVWLRVVADATQSPPTLHAEWLQMEGRPMWDTHLSLTQLTRPA